MIQPLIHTGMFEKIIFPIITVGFSIVSYHLVRWIRIKRHPGKDSAIDDDEARITPTKILHAISYSLIIYFFFGFHNNSNIGEYLLRWGGLLILANIDLFKSVVPFELVILAFFVRLFLPDFRVTMLDSLLGLLFIPGVFFLINKLILKFKGKFPIAFGDIMVCGLIGWYFGVVSGFQGVALGLILAGTFAFILRISRKSNELTFPMVPFIVLGSALMAAFPF